MNEFDRRLIEVARNHADLVDLAHVMGPNPLVEHFGYTVAVGTGAAILAQGVTQTALKTMQSDAFFVLHYVSSCIVDGTNFQWCDPSSDVDIQITDTGTGEILYSEPLSAGVLTATVGRAQSGVPLMLPIPRILPPNTNIKVDVTPNLADAWWFFLFLGGARVSL